MYSFLMAVSHSLIVEERVYDDLPSLLAEILEDESHAPVIVGS